MVFFRKVSAKRTSPPAARGKAGARAYAVGDIHGRLDLLNDMLGRIERDIAAHEPARTFIVFLGDFVDRGPESAGVIERLRAYQPLSATPVFLGGNHEEVLLRLLHGERDILASWLQYGGAECARSYGIDPEGLREMSEGAALKHLKARVPGSHREFLENLGDTFSFGDYLFVHAGIRPGVDLDDQDLTDLRWIREPFLSETREHGFVVVHGHTIVPEVEERGNRIGIDTGAYQTGILTALVVEEDRRRYIAADAAENRGRIGAGRRDP